MKAQKTIEIEGRNEFVIQQTEKIIQAVLKLSEENRIFLGNKISQKPNLLADKMPLIKTFI